MHDANYSFAFPPDGPEGGIFCPFQDRNSSSREEMSSVQTHSFRRAGSACDDYQLVTDTSGLNFPPGFEHLQKPWENPNTIVVTSETVDLGMNTLFSERVYTWSRWCNHPGCNFSFSST